MWMELTQHLVATVSFENLSHLSSEAISRMGAIGSWDWSHWDWSHTGHFLSSPLALLNTDVFAGTRSFFDHFFKTGQAWALLIGIIVGYVLRSFTSYG